MKKTVLVVLLLTCFIAGLAGQTALADSVSPNSPKIVSGKPFTVTFEYTYTGAPMTEADFTFAVDASQNISVAVEHDNKFWYSRSLQITPKSFNVDAQTNPEYTGTGVITVTVTGTAPVVYKDTADAIKITFTPRGQGSLAPINLKVTTK